jgi:hypothetical protein
VSIGSQEFAASKTAKDSQSSSSASSSTTISTGEQTASNGTAAATGAKQQPQQTKVDSFIETNLSNNSTSTVTSSSSSSQSSQARYSFSYIAANRDKEDELIKLEKFRQILTQNPINLEELQKASWKGIPKLYRPVSWKLLSDYLPLSLELQEKTIEQKRNAYWEAVNIHYTNTYLESHHDMLRQVKFTISLCWII